MIRFVKHAEHSGVSLIRPERDAGPLYARTLEAQGLAPSSVRVYLAAARALFKALRWAEVTAIDPFSDTTAAKDKTAAWDKRQPYSEEEVQVLLETSSLRDRTLILLCAHGGLRIMEALALTWADLQADALIVRHGKGGKGRRVTCSNTLLTALEDWCEVDGTPDGLIIGASQTAARERLRALCKRADVPYRGWHAFRHYAGTRLAARTSLENAARHLGHASIETTRVYAKWADRSLKDELARW
ncbi:integrase/recombinase XerD [Deinococcus marmoris]|uniref:Integrase/recombinase XerD n=1 Tax=Deinococcus marmoris TaxID=249408 RepID=A0A1U7P225_9DEIO|nr:integrase/recombinase XerD [Deinococcus marmoris]